jgi:hypothetical protein
MPRGGTSGNINKQLLKVLAHGIICATQFHGAFSWSTFAPSLVAEGEAWCLRQTQTKEIAMAIPYALPP